MSESVVSFTKQAAPGQVTPYWVLQQLAGIDAGLIFKFADNSAYINYDVPANAYCAPIICAKSSTLQAMILGWNTLR